MFAESQRQAVAVRIQPRRVPHIDGGHRHGAPDFLPNGGPHGLLRNLSTHLKLFSIQAIKVLRLAMPF
jgi:hypothetical protein